jgi:hypothetical protein
MEGLRFHLSEIGHPVTQDQSVIENKELSDLNLLLNGISK